MIVDIHQTTPHIFQIKKQHLLPVRQYEFCSNFQNGPGKTTSTRWLWQKLKRYDKNVTQILEG